MKNICSALLASTSSKEVEGKGFTLPWAAENCFAPQLVLGVRRRSAWCEASDGHGGWW